MVLSTGDVLGSYPIPLLCLHLAYNICFAYSLPKPLSVSTYAPDIYAAYAPDIYAAYAPDIYPAYAPGGESK